AGSIADLAAATVLLLLLVFVVVNASLYVLIRREGEAPGKFEVPAFLPLGGAVVCGALLVTRLISSDWVAPVLAAGLIAGILVIYAVYKPDASALERP
ncbi:MAG: amino acid transporter, partial [Hyphomicrobium sp.]